MNKKLLLASLVASVAGLSFLVAQDKEETEVTVQQCLGCDCTHTEEEAVEATTPAEEEEVKVSVSTQDEEVLIKAVSCSECDRGDKLAIEEDEESASV